MSKSPEFNTHAPFPWKVTGNSEGDRVRLKSSNFKTKYMKQNWNF